MCYTLFTLFLLFNTVQHCSHGSMCAYIYYLVICRILVCVVFCCKPPEQVLKKSFEVLFVSILAVGILSAHHGLQNSVWSKSMTLF